MVQKWRNKIKNKKQKEKQEDLVHIFHQTKIQQRYFHKLQLGTRYSKIEGIISDKMESMIKQKTMNRLFEYALERKVKAKFWVKLLRVRGKYLIRECLLRWNIGCRVSDQHEVDLYKMKIIFRIWRKLYVDNTVNIYIYIYIHIHLESI